MKWSRKQSFGKVRWTRIIKLLIVTGAVALLLIIKMIGVFESSTKELIEFDQKNAAVQAMDDLARIVSPRQEGALQEVSDHKVTHGLSPDVENRLREMMSQSHDGLEVIENPDGSKVLDLQGRFHHMATARVNSDGSISIQCFNDADALIASMNNEGISGASVTVSNPKNRGPFYR